MSEYTISNVTLALVDRADIMGTPTHRGWIGVKHDAKMLFSDHIQNEHGSYIDGLRHVLGIVDRWAQRHPCEDHDVVPLCQINVSVRDGNSFVASAMEPATETIRWLDRIISQEETS